MKNPPERRLKWFFLYSWRFWGRQAYRVMVEWHIESITSRVTHRQSQCWRLHCPTPYLCNLIIHPFRLLWDLQQKPPPPSALFREDSSAEWINLSCTHCKTPSGELEGGLISGDSQKQIVSLLHFLLPTTTFCNPCVVISCARRHTQGSPSFLSEAIHQFLYPFE